jgi:hypothetical protein
MLQRQHSKKKNLILRWRNGQILANGDGTTARPGVGQCRWQVEGREGGRAKVSHLQSTEYGVQPLQTPICILPRQVSNRSMSRFREDTCSVVPRTVLIVLCTAYFSSASPRLRIVTSGPVASICVSGSPKDLGIDHQPLSYVRYPKYPSTQVPYLCRLLVLRMDNTIRLKPELPIPYRVSSYQDLYQCVSNFQLCISSSAFSTALNRSASFSLHQLIEQVHV